MNDPVEILLVDDNPSDAELTLHVLSRHGFATVSICSRWRSGTGFHLLRRRLRGRDPTIRPRCCCSTQLPKVDGLEVLRRAKADPRTRAILIVVFSSSWEDRDLQRALELGAHSYVVKPVDFSQFVEAVRAALAVTRYGRGGVT